MQDGFIHPAGRVVISIYRALTSASPHLGSSDEASLALKRPGLTELRPALPGTEVWYPGGRGMVSLHPVKPMNKAM